MDAILFLHHLPLHEPLTRKHLVLMRALNPTCEVVPLCFESGRNTPLWQWSNADILALEWFDANHPKYERYFLLEYDTFCTQSVREFYVGVYDKAVACAMVINPWSNDIVPGPIGEQVQMRDWYWFRQNTNPDLYPYLRGLWPLTGVMLRHDSFYNMVQLWKSRRDLDHLFSECRLGTLAVMSGHEPVAIRPDCQRFMCAGDVNMDQGPGIYHRVKI